MKPIGRGLGDALIWSAAGTGKPTAPGKLSEVTAAAGQTGVFLGSGVTPDTLPALLPHSDGFIVGTYFKKDGIAANSVEEARVRQLLRCVTHATAECSPV
jgi:predicted TIM-barrel enzyme